MAKTIKKKYRKPLKEDGWCFKYHNDYFPEAHDCKEDKFYGQFSGELYEYWKNVTDNGDIHVDARIFVLKSGELVVDFISGDYGFGVDYLDMSVKKAMKKIFSVVTSLYDEELEEYTESIQEKDEDDLDEEEFMEHYMKSKSKKG